MSADPVRDARAILESLQDAVDARGVEALVGLFDEPAVLIGTTADARDAAGLREYLTAVATQSGALRWEWSDIVSFHQGDDSLGFAAFGDVVLADEDDELRAPIRLTLFAVETPDGWKVRQFHGSVPWSGPSTENSEFVRRHYEKLQVGEWKAAAEDYADDAANFGRPVGREGYLRVFEDIYTTFPDWSMEIVDIAAEGDNVIVRCRVSGTHLGVGRLPVNGGRLVGVEPTGRRFEVQHIHWHRLRDGRLVDHYAVRDDLGMMSQLGF